MKVSTLFALIILQFFSLTQGFAAGLKTFVVDVGNSAGLVRGVTSSYSGQSPSQGSVGSTSSNSGSGILIRNTIACPEIARICKNGKIASRKNANSCALVCPEDKAVVCPMRPDTLCGAGTVSVTKIVNGCPIQSCDSVTCPMMPVHQCSSGEVQVTKKVNGCEVQTCETIACPKLARWCSNGKLAVSDQRGCNVCGEDFACNAAMRICANGEPAAQKNDGTCAQVCPEDSVRSGGQDGQFVPGNPGTPSAPISSSAL